jgi:hypothetical protein
MLFKIRNIVFLFLNFITLLQIVSSVSFSRNQKLYAKDGAASDQFGISLSVGYDVALIGASDDDDKGVAYQVIVYYFLLSF